jgi:hypothetical protein
MQLSVPFFVLASLAKDPLVKEHMPLNAEEKKMLGEAAAMLADEFGFMPDGKTAAIINFATIAGGIGIKRFAVIAMAKNAAKQNGARPAPIMSHHAAPPEAPPVVVPSDFTLDLSGAGALNGGSH